MGTTFAFIWYFLHAMAGQYSIVITAESGFREQPPCRHPRFLNPDCSLNPDSFGSRKFPFQKSEASKSRSASKYQFSKYRLYCTLFFLHIAEFSILAISSDWKN